MGEVIQIGIARRNPSWLSKYPLNKLHILGSACGLNYDELNGPPWVLQLSEDDIDDDDLLTYHFWLDLHIWQQINKEADDQYLLDTSKWPKMVFDYWDFLQRPEVREAIDAKFYR